MATFNDFTTGLLGEKTSTSKSTKTNPLLGFLEPDTSWMPDKKKQQQMSLLQQGTAGNTPPPPLNEAREIEPYSVVNPYGPGESEFNKAEALEDNIGTGLKKFEEARSKIPEDVQGETEAEAAYRQEDITRLSTITDTEVDKTQKEVAKNTETGTDAKKATEAINDEVGKKLSQGGDDSAHVQEYKAIMESGVGEQTTQESFWDNLPGVDRIDWMTALLTAGTSIAMGNELGLAAANGMLNGLISGDKGAAREKTQASDAAIAQSKQAALDQRANMEEAGRNQRSADSIAQRDRAAQQKGGTLTADSVVQLFSDDVSSYNKFDEGEVAAYAPRLEHLAKSNPKMATLNLDQLDKIGKALHKGQAPTVQKLLKLYGVAGGI